MAAGFGRGAILPSLLFAISGCALFPKWHATGNYYPVAITWNDTSWCVPWRLKTALAKVSQRFGPVTVHSTFRWPLENWIKGGKMHSYHLGCRAVDFAVRGDPPGVTDFLIGLPEVGGYSRYRRASIISIPVRAGPGNLRRPSSR